MNNYTDLEIRILDKQEQGYPVEITFNGQQEFPRGFLDPDPAKWPENNRAKPQDTGNNLFNWLFADVKLKSAWDQACGESQLRRIRLRIDATAPELHAVPWELLRDPGNGAQPQDVAASEATPFSRYLAGSWIPGDPILQRPIKMLVAIANPTDLAANGFPAIQSELEFEQLKTLFGENNSNIKMERLPDPCTLQAIEAALGKGFHILHFIGHGTYAQASGQANLCLANDNNLLSLTPDTEIADMLARRLTDKLRLVYLSSCQGATRDPSNAFRGLAPRLVKCGVPAVIAMQDKVPDKTALDFSEKFYSALLDHGQIDRAANAARSSLLTVKDRGAGIPVLFMRQRDGQLFGKKGVIEGGVTGSFWSAMCKQVRNKKCIPMLGPGITLDLLPLPEELARKLAKNNYPFEDHADMRRVTQFLSITDDNSMRESVLEELTASIQLVLKNSSDIQANLKKPSDLNVEQWKELSKTFETEIHQKLASLNLPLYVTTNFDSFMTLALSAKSGQNIPVRRCHVAWRDKTKCEDSKSPPLLGTDNQLPPSTEDPVVLHLFGTDNELKSMVLTEDDHLDYLSNSSHETDKFLPSSINALLASNMLLFLGYHLQDLDLKVILRGLLKYLALEKWEQMQLAVQIEADKQDISKQEEVEAYLQKTFREYFSSKANVQIYWGSPKQFMAELTEQLTAQMKDLPNG